MPKELIEAFAKRENAMPIAVSIGWGRDTHVQMATVDMSRDDKTEGWYAHLDRDAINKVIRVLRRARDQAYGKDE